MNEMNGENHEPGIQDRDDHCPDNRSHFDGVPQGQRNDSVKEPATMAEAIRQVGEMASLMQDMQRAVERGVIFEISSSPHGFLFGTQRNRIVYISYYKEFDVGLRSAITNAATL